MTLAPYTTVQLLTQRYQDKQVQAGDIGVILEVYDHDSYEIEFSRADGTTIAWFAVPQDEVVAYSPLWCYHYQGSLQFIKPLTLIPWPNWPDLSLKMGHNILEIVGTTRQREVYQQVKGDLQRLAKLWHEAKGEIICTVEPASGESWLEFYIIQQTKLFCQKGRVVREQLEEV